MHATTVAIDLAKDVFELAFADGGGRILERKRLSRRIERDIVLNSTSRRINLPPLLANLIGEQAVFMLRRD